MWIPTIIPPGLLGPGSAGTTLFRTGLTYSGERFRGWSTSRKLEIPTGQKVLFRYILESYLVFINNHCADVGLYLSQQGISQGVK
jgi:hypothetical protein